MSNFSFEERPVSRNSSSREPQVTYNFVAVGSNDDQFVKSFAKSATPLVVSTIEGTLYRQDVILESGGHEIFYVAIPYAKEKRETGSYTFSFSTIGGTTHIDCSRKTVGTYNAPGFTPFVPLHGGAIGVTGDDILGCDIVIPQLKLTVSFRHPLGHLNLAQLRRIHDVTGHVNSTEFLTFEPGEVLFLGATGSEGTDAETTVQYEFAVSPNQTDLTIGETTGIEKKGHDYLWIDFAESTSGGFPVRKPRFIYVEEVYPRADLADVLGFGG